MTAKRFFTEFCPDIFSIRNRLLAVHFISNWLLMCLAGKNSDSNSGSASTRKEINHNLKVAS
jgi:hypothetical protein